MKVTVREKKISDIYYLYALEAHSLIHLLQQN
jgi:hypothetical protein